MNTSHLTNEGVNAFTNERLREIVAAQRRFFRTGETLPISWRIRQLKRLKEAVMAHQDAFDVQLILALENQMFSTDKKPFTFKYMKAKK